MKYQSFMEHLLFRLFAKLAGPLFGNAPQNQLAKLVSSFVVLM